MVLIFTSDPLIQIQQLNCSTARTNHHVLQHQLMQILLLVPIIISTMDITNERSNRLVVVIIGTTISEEHAAILRATPEDGRSLFLQNFGV